MKYLNKIIRKYMWIYERENGDRGFVLAKNYNEAVEKLQKIYSDARKRIERTEEAQFCDCKDWMYLYHCMDSTAACIGRMGEGDVFVIECA